MLCSDIARIPSRLVVPRKGRDNSYSSSRIESQTRKRNENAVESGNKRIESKVVRGNNRKESMEKKEI